MFLYNIIKVCRAFILYIFHDTYKKVQVKLSGIAELAVPRCPLRHTAGQQQLGSWLDTPVTTITTYTLSLKMEIIDQRMQTQIGCIRSYDFTYKYFNYKKYIANKS